MGVICIHEPMPISAQLPKMACMDVCTWVSMFACMLSPRSLVGLALPRSSLLSVSSSACAYSVGSGGSRRERKRVGVRGRKRLGMRGRKRA